MQYVVHSSVLLQPPGLLESVAGAALSVSLVEVGDGAILSVPLLGVGAGDGNDSHSRDGCLGAQYSIHSPLVLQPPGPFVMGICDSSGGVGGTSIGGSGSVWRAAFCTHI